MTLTLPAEHPEGDELTWTSKAGKPYKFIATPGEYTLTEDAAPAGYEVATEVKFEVDENGTATVTEVKETYGEEEYVVSVAKGDKVILRDAPKPPETEKYVNKDVDATLETFDEVFDYDVMAYVTMDGKILTVTDTLVPALEFVKDGDDDATGASIKVYDMGTENNHKDTVAGSGTEISPTSAKAEGQTLTVVIEELDKKDLQGHWIKVSFKAQIKESAYAAVKAFLDEKTANGEAADAAEAWANIGADENGLVLIKKEHDGVPNQAKYTLKTENGGTFNEDTNTVTIEPTTTKVEVSKEWLLDDVATDWPAGATVEVILRATGEGADKTGVDGLTATLDADNQTAVFDNLPKVSTVTYSVEEGTVVNGGAYTLGQVEDLGGGIFKITNKTYTPEIEKYVNPKANDEDLFNNETSGRDGTVHTDLSAFDEIYTYDIQAFITPDAKYVEVIDELREVLEFADETPENVKVFVKDGSGTAKNPPALTAEGTATDNYVIDEEAWKANKLILTMGSDAEDAKVLAEAGKWLQITFDAKIKSEYKSVEALQAAGENVWTEIVENDPIEDADINEFFSGVVKESHDGIVNDSYYNINKLVAGVYVDNMYQYSDRSNTVTVQPESTPVFFSKTDLEGEELEGAKMKLTDADGNVIDEWTSTVEDHEMNLADGEYILTEEIAPEGFYCVTTKMRFEVKDGQVTLLTTTVDAGGQLELLPGNIIILKDMAKVQAEYEPEIPEEEENRLIPPPEVKSVNNVDTGDNNSIYIWIAILILAACATILGAIMRRRTH